MVQTTFVARCTPVRLLGSVPEGIAAEFGREVAVFDLAVKIRQPKPEAGSW